MTISLYNGNCLDILEDKIKECFNPIIVTDPPFNIGFKYDKYKDKMTEEEYFKMLKDICGLCPSVVIHYPEQLYRLAIELGKPPVKVVSWIYNSNIKKQHRDIAFFDVKPDFRKVTQPYKDPKDKRVQAMLAKGKTGAAIYDWWNINQVKNISKEKTAHPCQMPLKVMTNIVGILPDDATIIDPFMGSGTTGVACKKYGKDFIGIELSVEYFNIAKERIENYVDEEDNV